EVIFIIQRNLNGQISPSMLIEDEERERHSDVNPSKPSSSTNKDASDGFETASDGELGLNGSDNDDETQQQHQVQEEQQSLSQTDDLKQKAFEQANDVKLEGNRLFGSGQYEEALSQYVLALHLAPDMPLSVELRRNQGMHKSARTNPSYMKALLRRAEAHEKLEHFDEAIADMKKILELDPSNDQAKKTIHRLGPLAEEKREKMKEEMIGQRTGQLEGKLGNAFSR
ncbi:Tetratricopeptide repeat-like superfamily protein, partial [Prunus dulcis]